MYFIGGGTVSWFIPTRVGNTGSPATWELKQAVHPHASGEHAEAHAPHYGDTLLASLAEREDFSTAGVVYLAGTVPAEDAQPAFGGPGIALLASVDDALVGEPPDITAIGAELVARVDAGVEQPQALVAARLSGPGTARRARQDGEGQDTS